MIFHTLLRKMATEMDTPIRYFLDCEGDVLLLHDCLNHQLTLSWEGTQCLHCQQEKPLFRQGFCQSCFFEIPQAAEWVMRPELSKAHLDIEDRDISYEKKVQLQPHIVYLASSSHLKVGITRKSQLPTRWIDQGAHLAVPLLEVPNRYLSGVAEVAMKAIFSDKTNWRKMLQNESEPVDWQWARDQFIAHLPENLKPYLQARQDPTAFHYPVLDYPQKVKSLNITKTPKYQGRLIGVKGQYLLFEDQTVFNIRSYEGNRLQITVH
ncbi:MAG: DUF2797 domain-containing protein [Flavobacteriaceae bacterium]